MYIHLAVAVVRVTAGFAFLTSYVYAIILFIVAVSE